MKLILADYIFIAGLLFLVGAHLATNFMITYYQEEAERVGIAKEVVLEMEVNPVARFFMGFERFRLIYSYIFAPMVLSGLYWIIRNKYKDSILAIEAYAISFFMMGFLNFLNDASILLGVLM